MEGHLRTHPALAERPHARRLAALDMNGRVVSPSAAPRACPRNGNTLLGKLRRQKPQIVRRTIARAARLPGDRSALFGGAPGASRFDRQLPWFVELGGYVIPFAEQPEARSSRADVTRVLV